MSFSLIKPFSKVLLQSVWYDCPVPSKRMKDKLMSTVKQCRSNLCKYVLKYVQYLNKEPSIYTKLV